VPMSSLKDFRFLLEETDEKSVTWPTQTLQYSFF
jgi:hypothetical protein